MADHVEAQPAVRERSVPRMVEGLPPQTFFLVSAVFHYLGPSFAVLLFAQVDVLGVAWLRVSTAAAIFAVWRRPWRVFACRSRSQRGTMMALGVTLGAMNACFYLAIDRLPLATVGAIEFLGPIALAAIDVRTTRNAAAMALAVVGVSLLTQVRLVGQPVGFAFAFANCALFMLYVLLGHRIAQDGGTEGIDRLASAMLIGLVAVSPIGLVGAAATFSHPTLLLAGIGVGVCSSVIPYVCDQLAMARLSRSTFALMLALLPASATVIGVIVLHQIPSVLEAVGVGLVILGIRVHEERNVA